LARLAIAEQGLEQWDAALAHLDEALEIYINRGDLDMVGKTFTDLAAAFMWAGRYQEAAETADRGLDLAAAFMWAGRSQEAAETANRGLAHMQAEVSAERARLLAAFAQARAATGVYEPAHEALQEALSIASKLSDPTLEARLLGARSIVNFHFLRLTEGAADGLFSEQSGASESRPWQRALQLRTLHQTLLYLGRVEEAARIADTLEPLAKKIGQSYAIALCLNTRAWVEFGKAPDLDKLEATFQQFSESSQKARFTFWEVLSEVQLSQIDFFRGNWASALLHARVSHNVKRGGSIEGLGAGTLFRQMAYAGDRDGAFAILNEHRARLPRSGQQNTRGSWWMLALVIEGLVMLGEKPQAGELYPLARELIGTGAVALWPIFRFTQTVAGVAAAAARQWGAAEEHFQIAMQQAESFPSRLEEADIRRFHAMMLMDRAAPGDREKAQTLLNEALECYTRIGMPGHVEMTRTLLDRAAGRQK
jgi:tetratricopeptide (TPR) repeat protein